MHNTVFNPTKLVRHPFAVMQPDQVDRTDQSGGVDNLALILPFDAAPMKLKDTQRFVPVSFNESIIYWQGADGCVHAVSQWHTQPPTIDPIVMDAITQEEGMLVFFLDPGEAQPRCWSIFKCEDLVISAPVSV